MGSKNIVNKHVTKTYWSKIEKIKCNVKLQCKYCNTFLLTSFKDHSHRAKVKAKANILFDVWNFFFDLLPLFFDLFSLSRSFRLVWTGPYRSNKPHPTLTGFAAPFLVQHLLLLISKNWWTFSEVPHPLPRRLSQVLRIIFLCSYFKWNNP